MKASDLSDDGILSVLMKMPGTWHTTPHGSGGIMPIVYDPANPDAPYKVLLAKLRSMKRRGLIDGCGCGCRGDWHVIT
jgi:hypothetical protein